MARRVLMFSSGMDSFILKYLYGFKNEECLFVNMGTKENGIEHSFIKTFFPEVRREELRIVKWELENKIIPFRNHFLALVGAQYANEIFFAFTAGDTSKDKDFMFQKQMETVLDYFASDKDRVRVQGPFSIQMPFKLKTKTELVKEYLSNDGSLNELLFKSRSCYVSGTKLPCGTCKPCIRKFIALTLNKIECQKAFVVSPVEKLEEFYQSCLDRDRKQEGEEAKKCLEKFSK